MTTFPTTIQRQDSLARGLLHTARYYLWRSRVLLTLATIAIVTGLALNWAWLVAAACMMSRSAEKQSALVGDAAHAANAYDARRDEGQQKIARSEFIDFDPTSNRDGNAKVSRSQFARQCHALLRRDKRKQAGQATNAVNRLRRGRIRSMSGNTSRDKAAVRASGVVEAIER